MQGVNPYWRQLTSEEIAAGLHRDAVGGLWEEMGELQFEFLRQQGLLPEHRLLDVGCGSLRGGLFFINYLNSENYYGLDINESLIVAGQQELNLAGLTEKSPHLLVTPTFAASEFGVQFDFILAQSVFTHLFMNHIVRCLVEMKSVLQPEGRFYATFFEVPDVAQIRDVVHQPGGIVTHLDSDPFHYSFEEMSWFALQVGFEVERVSNWQHPRSQKGIGCQFRLAVLVFDQKCDWEVF